MTYRGHVVGPRGEHLAPSTVTPEQLAAGVQAEHDRINAAIKAREDREAAFKAEQARIQAEAGQVALAQYREQAKAAYLAAGGGAEHWPSVWTELEKQCLLEQAQSKLTFHERAVEQAKHKLRASGRYSF